MAAMPFDTIAAVRRPGDKSFRTEKAETIAGMAHDDIKGGTESRQCADERMSLPLGSKFPSDEASTAKIKSDAELENYAVLTDALHERRHMAAYVGCRWRKSRGIMKRSLSESVQRPIARSFCGRTNQTNGTQEDAPWKSPTGCAGCLDGA